MASGSLTDALRETIATFDEPGVPLTTSEVADRLDLGRRSTFDRLERLADGGHLETKKVGARGRVWWRPTPSAGAGHDPSGRMLSRLIGNVPGMVYRCRNERGWPLSFVSEAARDITGYDPSAIESGEVSWDADIVHPDDREAVWESVTDQLEDGDEFTLSYRIRTADGEVRWVRSYGCAVVDAGSGRDVLEGVVTDVTDQERSKRALARREQQFRSLVDATEEYAIFMLDPEGRVRTWNSGARRIKGYERDEIVGEHFSTFYTADDRAAGVPAGNLSAAAERGSVEDEGWRVRRDGSRFWANVTITAITDDGELRGYAKVTRDMTDRRERERKLRRERDVVERILETSPVGLAVLSHDGLEQVNERAAEIYGSSTGDLDEYAVSEAEVFDADGEPVPPGERPNARVLETGEPVDGWECQLEGVDGQRRWLSVSAAPLYDNGEVERVVVATEDITRLKQQARQLERRRDELEAELDGVFERIDDAFYALDEQFRFTYVNERAEQLLQHPERELLGQSVWEVFPEASETPAWESFHEALETQEPTSYEVYFRPLGFWVEANVYPSETGLSVYFRDASERKERELELERYETIFQAVGDAIYVVDGHQRFVQVNRTAEELTGYDREELLGAHVADLLGESAADRAFELSQGLEDDERSVAAAEFTLATADGEDVPLDVRFTRLPTAQGRVEFVGVARDISERKSRERDLERYETIVETVDDGIYVVDADGQLVLVNDAYAEQTGYSREALVGMSADQLVPEETIERARAYERELVDGERQTARLEADVLTAEGGSFRGEATFSIIETAGEGYERVGVVRDVTERVARERELETRIRQQEAVTTLGRQALEARDLDALMADAAEYVAETLGNDYCKVLDLDADADELLLRQGVGWADGVVGSSTVSASEDDSQAAYTLRSRQPVVVDDLTTETRFSGPDLLTDHDVQSGISTVIGQPDDPWGILGTHDRSPKEFSVHDVNFVQSVANILATAIDRYHREQELARQRERLAALDDLNRVVRGLTEAVIDQSTREEIEAVVCEGLASTDSYGFAWIGEVDGQTQTMSLRTEAGVDGYLADRTISVDPDDPGGAGPIRRAVETHEMQVIEDVLGDEAYERWHEHAREWNYRSAAVVPIVHEGVLHGVLCVYADRPHAFSGGEYEVIGHLGEVVAHAIAAVERKRALTSSEVVELEFRIAGIFDALDLPAAEGQLTLGRSVPVGKGAYLVYGTATDDMLDVLDAIVESLPHWDAVRRLGEASAEGVTRFEARLVDPPVLSTVTALGGYVDEARIENDDYYMRVHLAPSSDARRLLDVVQEDYPMAKLVTRQQITREEDPPSRLSGVLAEELTERQRAALEAAYFAGYFEWPRDADGETVAGALDVSAPTFHQHLRNAQRKLLQVALDDARAA